MAIFREIPIIGILLEKSGFLMQGDVPKVQGEGALEHMRRKNRATTLNTYDWFRYHEFQHHMSDLEVKGLLAELQPDSTKILNSDKYFKKPPPIGCALRIFR